MTGNRTLRRCARGHIMKPHWTECEICDVKVDRTPRALEMIPPPLDPTLIGTGSKAPPAARAGAKPALVGVLVVPERDEIHKLRAGDNAVGASETNDILIEGKFVSASHALISFADGGGFQVVDLESTNGTFLNDQRVSRAAVADGDRLRFGNVTGILKSVV
jgi:pSer/pThr/pTyr-binding forkhead associated (FHA) protein